MRLFRFDISCAPGKTFLSYFSEAKFPAGLTPGAGGIPFKSASLWQ